MIVTILMAKYLSKVNKKHQNKVHKIILVFFLITVERYSLIGMSLGDFIIMMKAFTYDYVKQEPSTAIKENNSFRFK